MVRAYDARTGELLWDDQFDYGGGIKGALDIAAQGGIVYAAGSGRTAGGGDEWVVRAYDAWTGELLWDDQFDNGNEACAIAAQGGRVYAAGSGRTAGFDDEWVVRAYDARTGELLWDDQFDKGGGDNEAFAIAVQGGRVYAAGRGETAGGAREWVVRAYDDFTGTTNGPVAISSSDHFLSYQIKHEAEVFLADQFMEGLFTIKEPLALLNPADKGGGGIIDPSTHLVGYRVKGPELDKVESVLVKNQFGEFVVDVKKPDRLLVPASKSLIEPPSAPDNSTHNVDHFLCYKIEDDDGDENNLGIQISVVDQFNQPKLFKIRKPRRLCNPVNKNGEGVKDPKSHLMSFSVKRASGEPKHERVQSIFVNDQFGPGRVDTKEERELWVPSTITLLDNPD